MVLIFVFIVLNSRLFRSILNFAKWYLDAERQLYWFVTFVEILLKYFFFNSHTTTWRNFSSDFFDLENSLENTRFRLTRSSNIENRSFVFRNHFVFLIFFNKKQLLILPQNWNFYKLLLLVPLISTQRQRTKTNGHMYSCSNFKWNITP